MDLEIRYENGSMTVHLEEFLNIRSIAKVRKLLKLIRSSFTPECEQQLKNLFRNRLNNLNRFRRNTAFTLKGIPKRLDMQNSRSDRHSILFHRFRRVLKTRSFSGIQHRKTQRFGRIARLM